MGLNSPFIIALRIGKSSYEREIDEYLKPKTPTSAVPTILVSTDYIVNAAPAN